jgi:glycosyltransferase involved in cell wall biosynthesis
MIRVLHVIPSLALQTGGPSVLVIDLALALLGQEVESRLLTTDALTPAQARRPLSGAAFRDFPLGAESLDIQIHPLRQPYRFAYSPTLYRALDRQVASFDLVHIHSVNLFPQYAAWRMATKHNVPYIVTPHGALDPWIRGKRRLLKAANDMLWQRRMLNGSAAIHLTTEDERALIERMHIRAPQVVVPNGTHVHKFTNHGDGILFRQKWLNGYDGPLVLNHGRLSDKKGLDILVAAMAQLQDARNAQLALVGADDEGIGDVLRGEARMLGVERQLHIIPRLSGKELLNAIAAADVWALPSHSENFGLAVVEAMAAGKPVVTSPHVNMAPDAAKADALMMVPNTKGDVAEAIRSLLDDPQRRRQLGRHAADYVQRYDWSHVAQEFIELYRSVIKEYRK